MNSELQSRQRRFLILVALVFFAPLALSFLLYYGGAWHPVGHVNKGVLIQPARPLPELSLQLAGSGRTDAQFLKRKWTLLLVQHGRCDTACLGRLYDMRQVRLALDREMGRVQRVFVADADCCDMGELRATHPDLIIVADSLAAQPLLALLPGDAGDSGRVYLVDPLGNLMMFYPPDAAAKGMLQDLKRLLQLSQVG